MRCRPDSRGILALIGMLTASFFLSNLEAGHCGFCLRLGPVLAGIAERQARGAPELQGWPDLRRRAPISPAFTRPRRLELARFHACSRHPCPRPRWLTVLGVVVAMAQVGGARLAGRVRSGELAGGGMAPYAPSRRFNRPSAAPPLHAELSPARASSLQWGPPTGLRGQGAAERRNDYGGIRSTTRCRAIPSTCASDGTVGRSPIARSPSTSRRSRQPAAAAMARWDRSSRPTAGSTTCGARSARPRGAARYLRCVRERLRMTGRHRRPGDAANSQVAGIIRTGREIACPGRIEHAPSSFAAVPKPAPRRRLRPTGCAQRNHWTGSYVLSGAVPAGRVAAANTTATCPPLVAHFQWPIRAPRSRALGTAHGGA